MDHLMANHGWQKPCPMMPQGSKNLVGQMMSEERCNKISKDWLITSKQRGNFLSPKETHGHWESNNSTKKKGWRNHLLLIG